MAEIDLAKLKEFLATQKSDTYKAKAQRAIWRENNPEKIAEYQRRQEIKRKAKKAEYNRAYYLKRKAEKLQTQGGVEHDNE